jgi:hypothetical protein
MIKFDINHGETDPLQSLSISDWNIRINLLYEIEDLKYIRALIKIMSDFLKNPNDRYIWMDYFDLPWKEREMPSFWFWYQDNNRQIQISLFWTDVWLDLNKEDIINFIDHLIICKNNLIVIKRIDWNL